MGERTKQEAFNLASIGCEIDVEIKAKNDMTVKPEKDDKKNVEKNEKVRNQDINEMKETLEWDGKDENKKVNHLNSVKRNSLNVLYIRKIVNIINTIKKNVNKFYFVHAVSTLIHFFIYVNRGIIAGSYDYLSCYFSTHFDIKDTDLHIGILFSTFIFGLSISSILCGSLASAYGVLKVTTIFLLQNTLALFFTGVSLFYKSYYFLVFCRFFAGFSEAAFLNCIPSLIYYYSKDKAGAWISIFFTMFPLGGCTGYVLAVIFSNIGITLVHYFFIMSIVFLIMFSVFFFFDDCMLRKYEKTKELKQKRKKLEETKQKENENVLETEYKEIEKENVDIEKMEKGVTNVDDTQGEFYIKYNKKHKNLSNKKEKKTENEKQKSTDLNQESTKTNSLKTECIDTDDLAMFEKEKKNSEKRKAEKNAMIQSNKQKEEAKMEKNDIKSKTNKNVEKSKGEKNKENSKRDAKQFVNKPNINNTDFLKNEEHEKNQGKLQNEKSKMKNELKEENERDKKLIKTNDKLKTDSNEEDITNVSIGIMHSSEVEKDLLNTQDILNVNNQMCDKPTITDLIYVTLFNPAFICIVIALTAYSEIIQNHLIYGAPILYFLRIFPSYEMAIVTCGISACVSSVLGTCVAGFILDIIDVNIQEIDKNYENVKKCVHKIQLYEKDTLVYKYLNSLGLLTSIILVFTSIAFLLLPFVHLIYPFTILMITGFILLFLTVTALNVAVMICVPNNFRPFSMGISTFITHIFGDIPWVVIFGKIKSVLAPDCIMTEKKLISTKCDNQRSGLVWTLFFLCSKTLIMNLGCLILYAYSRSKIKKLQNNITPSIEN